MPGATKPRVIAIEEHYFDADLSAKMGRSVPPALQKRLLDLGEARLKDMDAAGIDMQVLSHGAPAAQTIEAEAAIPLSRQANDRLHEVVRAHPDRFAGFAVLPTADPKAAADELERSVSKLGFKGAMVHGLTLGRFFDEKQFWPICERAQALDVPIYLHPAPPHPAVVDIYYKEYVQRYPGILSAAWGFTVESATQGLRMVLSRVFDSYPRLQIILGHLGEGLPFLLRRIDESLSRPGNEKLSFRQTFCDHVHITTSGNFSDPALFCSMLEMGVDRIMFAVDWPFVENAAGTNWMARVQLSEADREKILGGNARKLLRI